MKKIILSVFVLSILVPAVTFASFDTSLKYGSRGDAVSTLQDFLKDQGFLKGSTDGRFGLGTLRAVEAFQKVNSLPADGYFGLQSRTKANTILATILAPLNQEEKTETGTVTTPTTVVTQPVLDSRGCSATSLFSSTTGQSCLITAPVVSPTPIVTPTPIVNQTPIPQPSQSTTPTPTVPTVTAPTPVVVAPTIPTYSVPSVTVIKNSMTIGGNLNTGTKSQIIGSFTIVNNSTVEGITVNGLVVNLPQNSLVTNLTLGGVPNPSYNQTSVISSPTASNTFSVSFTVPADAQQTINIIADIGNTVGTLSASFQPSSIVGQKSNLSVSISPVVGQTFAIVLPPVQIPTPIAWWNFNNQNDVTSGLIADQQGSYNAQNVNATWTSNGYDGGGLNLSGYFGNGFKIGNMPALSQMTVMFRMKTDGSTTADAVNSLELINNWNFNVSYQNGVMGVGVPSGSLVKTLNVDQSWHNYAISYDGQNVTLYVDGQVKGYSTAGNIGATVAGEWDLGLIPQGNGTTNQVTVDDFKIYNQVLSATTLSSLQ